jgi:hypothetical protein
LAASLDLNASDAKRAVVALAADLAAAGTDGEPRSLANAIANSDRQRFGMAGDAATTAGFPHRFRWGCRVG